MGREKILEECSEKILEEEEYIKLSKELIKAFKENNIMRYSAICAEQMNVVMNICYQLGLTHKKDTHEV